MAKRKGKVYPKLGLELLKYFAFALFGAGLVTVLLGAVAYIAVNEVTLETTKQENLRLSVNKFQEYVTKERVYSTDVGSIRRWNQKNPLIDFVVYDDVVLYSSRDKEGTERYQPYRPEEEASRFPKFTIKFQDKSCTLSVAHYYHMPFQAVWGILIYLVPFVSFIAIFGVFLETKIRYINELEEGIHIIEGGGLEYRIPIRGKDELTSLAESINAMSGAMKERVRSEETEKKQENDLVASISHDIRTPLTTAICYLDLVHDKRFTSPQQERQYIENAREKVHHIKYLTDNLFEHSVQGMPSGELRKELVDGRELLAQLLSELQFLLEDKGFTVETHSSLEAPFQLNVSVSQIRRVFDNLGSNVIKYAEPGTTVSLTARVHKENLIVQQKNKMRRDDEEAESFGIGMQNCVRILKAHKGSLEAGCRDGVYQTILHLPLWEE